MRIADELGVAVTIRLYLKDPPDAATLRAVVERLEDPVTDLVRRDAQFTKLGLTEADVATPEQVVAVLVRHKQLLQRPLLVLPDRALIGRPKERVADALAPYAPG